MDKNIVQIAILRKLPRSKGVFDYKTPLDLKVKLGDLVMAPFKSGNYPGIVVGIGASPKAPQNLRSINCVLSSDFLRKEELFMMSWLAKNSGVSLGLAGSMFVPFLPTSKKPYNNRPQPLVVPKKLQSQPIIVIPKSLEHKKKLALQLINQVLLRRQQILILVPEVFYIQWWRDFISSTKKVQEFYSGQQSTIARLTWLETRAGQADVIIGTRAALWLQYHNLGGIIIDQGENENHVQSNQNPRYDAVEAAQQLAGVWHSSLAIFSFAPRLEQWQASNNKKFLWREFILPINRFKIVSTFGLKVQQGLITDELQQLVEKSLTNKGRVLLYLNKRGARGFICQDCGYQARCSRCSRTMMESDHDRLMICYHCQEKQNIPLPCPSCHGNSFRYTTRGLDDLYKSVNNLWPEAKAILLQDSFDYSTINLVKKARLIVGTSTAWRVLYGQNLELAALVRADNEISLPEFRSVERTWQLLRNLLVSAKTVVCQTSLPKHQLWQYITSYKTNTFYQAELTQRKLYHYPPVVKILRLTIESLNNETAKKEALDLFSIVSKNLPTSAEVIGPYPDYYQRRGKKWRWHILLKYPNNWPFEQLWSQLPDNVIIDPQPYFILS